MAPDPHTDLPPLQLNHTSSDPTHISRTSADETDSARLSADVARSGSVGGGGGGSGGRGSLTLKRGGFEGRLDLSDLSPVGSSLPPSAANSVANTPLGESAWEAVRLGMRAESQAQAQAQAQEQAQAQAANGKGKESADHPPRRKGSMSHGNGSRYHFAWPTSPIDVARKRQLGAETSRSSALPPAGRQDAAATAADGNDASSTDRMPSAGGENGAAGSSSRTNTDNRGGRDQETSLDTEVEPSSMTISNTSTTPQNERRAQLQPLGSAQRPPLPHQHTFRAGAPEPSAAQGGSPADLATAIPKLHRALTVPLSARLGHLRHPGQSSMDTVQVNGSPRQSGEASQASAVVSSSKEEEGEADGDLESRSSPDKAASGAPSNGKEPATGRRRGLDFQRSATSPALIQSDRSQLSCLDARDEADHHPLAGFSNLLADFVQLPINTLLQLIPPHLLDPTHEQFSACSLHVPVTSVEALLEACRALNYLSKEMRRLGDEEASKLVRDRADSTQSLSRPAVLDGADQQVQEAGSAANIEPDQSCIEGGSTASEAGPSRSRLSLGLSDRSQNSASSSPQTPTFVRWGSHVHEDFDIGEMTQRIADVLSGMAAQKSVDLVIFHGDIALGKEDPSRDVELGHQSVRGDEGGVRFAVMHVSTCAWHGTGARHLRNIFLLHRWCLGSSSRHHQVQISRLACTFCDTAHDLNRVSGRSRTSLHQIQARTRSGRQTRHERETDLQRCSNALSRSSTRPHRVRLRSGTFFRTRRRNRSSPASAPLCVRNYRPARRCPRQKTRLYSANARRLRPTCAQCDTKFHSSLRVETQLSKRPN